MADKPRKLTRRIWLTAVIAGSVVGVTISVLGWYFVFSPKVLPIVIAFAVAIAIGVTVGQLVIAASADQPRKPTRRLLRMAVIAGSVAGGLILVFSIGAWFWTGPWGSGSEEWGLWVVTVVPTGIILAVIVAVIAAVVAVVIHALMAIFANRSNGDRD
jgi:hypothetical protein